MNPLAILIGLAQQAAVPLVMVGERKLEAEVAAENLRIHAGVTDEELAGFNATLEKLVAAEEGRGVSWLSKHFGS